MIILALMGLVGLAIWSFSLLDWHLREETKLIGESLKTLLIILFSWVLLKIIQVAVWHPLESKLFIKIPRIITSLTYLCLWVGVALLVTVVIFKQPLSSWVAFGSVATAGLAFVLQNLIQDFVSGLILDVESTYEEGDWIRLNNGQEGEVVEITWRLTTLKTLENQLLFVPNSTLTKENYLLLTPHMDKTHWQ
ncbi:MAG TPA: mechanosensitive ion channel family protein, partial [Alphaproteobacteria bacterium]|nr:mechanosensitive ion channel family protein [Alphaproteobacteria bacterium]